MEQRFPAGLEDDAQVFVGGARVHRHSDRVVCCPLQVDRRLPRRLFHAAHVPQRIPRLLEHLRLARLNPRVVRLVVGIAADHQLEIRAVLVGEDAVPVRAFRPGSPLEELLARHGVVIGDVDEARLLTVVVPGQEVVGVVPREDRDRRRMVLPPAHVHAGEVVAAVAAAPDRPRRELALRVLGAELGRWRKDDLVVLVGVDRDVREVQERLRERRAVDQADRRVHVRAPRMERHADGPPHPVAQLQLAHPHRLAAIVFLLDAVLDGHGTSTPDGDAGCSTRRRPRSTRRPCR